MARIVAAMLWLNVVLLLGSAVLWVIAVPTGWVNSTAFVSHISMAALLFSAISGVAAGAAGKAVEDKPPSTE